MGGGFGGKKKKQPHRKIDEAAQNCSKWDARECLLINNGTEHFVRARFSTNSDIHP